MQKGNVLYGAVHIIVACGPDTIELIAADLRSATTHGGRPTVDNPSWSLNAC